VPQVLERNPAAGIRAGRVTAPLPDPLYLDECEQLLTAAGSDPRTYLVIPLLLEPGLKKVELMSLDISNFDFSNRYC
jgi:integrase